MSALPSPFQSPTTGLSSRAPKLGPQVSGIPAAVAIEIDEPLAVNVETQFVDSVAVEIAGDGNRVFEADHMAMNFVAVRVEQNPLGVGHGQIGPIELARAKALAKFIAMY